MALWEIKTAESAHNFGVIQPIEVLADFDGPLTFTFFDEHRKLHLAHLCDYGVGVSRYLVCETTDETISHLVCGSISYRTAVLQPPLWMIDIRPDGSIAHAWETPIEDLPNDAIPVAGVLLDPELDKQRRLTQTP